MEKLFYKLIKEHGKLILQNMSEKEKLDILVSLLETMHLNTIEEALDLGLLSDSYVQLAKKMLSKYGIEVII
jgi:hypothetical protein